MRAIADLKEICSGELEGKVDLQTIDVLEQPDLAQNERIFATPTLIKTLPAPIMRVIGDLSDKEKVLLKLDIINFVE